ncbi:MAG: NYN domain-containing protein [Candidatus Omnitrophica bacterium]|nr:NYN domain-containing protein [Candidatus Omnitrophota bacterium]
MSLHYIIDGYNVVRHRAFVSVKKTGDECRALVFLLNRDRLGGSARNRITVVFDGYPGVNVTEKENAAITVLYSRAVSADEKIKKIVESSGNPKVVVVVSDDREVRFFARSAGAKVMGVEEFLAVKGTKPGVHGGDSGSVDLNYSQREMINEELRKLWLEKNEKNDNPSSG